jgi:transcriptional regulator with XRE-family HTH domain
MKTFNKDKLNKIAKPDPNNWVEKAKWRSENEAWLDKSAKIALKILRHIRKEKINQIQLSEMLKVTPQNVSKILKGHENLTLETITKFEITLGISLMEVPEYEFTIDYDFTALDFSLEDKGSVKLKNSAPYLELLNSVTSYTPDIKLAVGW